MSSLRCFRFLRGTLLAGLSLLLSPILPAAADSGGDCRTHPDFVSVPADGTTGITASRTINGLLGGTVTAGRYTLIVPPGAIRGTATVYITVPDPSVMRCNLDISPASANDFRLPVLLVADYSGANVNPLALVTLWRDPAQNTWCLVPGSLLDLASGLLKTPLWHFSQYGTCDTKAGW